MYPRIFTIFPFNTTKKTYIFINRRLVKTIKVNQHIGILHRMKWEGIICKGIEINNKKGILLNNMYVVISFYKDYVNICIQINVCIHMENIWNDTYTQI